MKKFNHYLLIGILISFSNKSFSQAESGTFLKSGKEDARKLIDAYMSPLLRGFGESLNNGWYNTAKPLGLGGFDIRANLGFSFVPSSDQSFEIDKLGLNTDPSKPRLVMQPGSSNSQSTLFGEKKDVADTALIRMSLNVPGTGVIDTILAKFPMPPGLGVAATHSLPMAQLGIGVGKMTEITIRYMPALSVGDFKSSLYGFGVKHDIKQWIPTLSIQPLWNWSVIGGYTKFNTEYLIGSLLSVDTSAYNPDPTILYDNQKMVFNGYGWFIGTIASVKLAMFTVYGGVNYASSKVELNMEGNYPIPGPNDQISPTNMKVTKINNVKDPIKLEGSLSGFRANAGLRIKLAVLTISGEYSVGQYNSATLGIGINWQSIVPPKM